MEEVERISREVKEGKEDDKKVSLCKLHNERFHSVLIFLLKHILKQMKHEKRIAEVIKETTPMIKVAMSTW